ncbi:replication restart helicase PriA [Jutongia sp.]
MIFADVIVDISVKSLDRPFQYIVPEEMIDDAVIGAMVIIPFGSGNRELKGYIIGLSGEAKFDVERTKAIKEIVKQGVVAESHLLSLAYWIKENYGSTMNDAIKAVLPVRREIKKKVSKTVYPCQTRSELEQTMQEFAKKHNQARVRVLQALLNQEDFEQGIPYERLKQEAGTTMAVLHGLEEKDIVSVTEERQYRNPVTRAGGRDQAPVLNEQQRNIVDTVTGDYRQGIRKTYLIHGVTGSGKTEVYMGIIEQVIAEHKQVIVLIPEIALTFQTVNRFYRRFGERVSVMHSRLSQGEKFDQFERAKAGEIDIMIGPRSALFTPFEHLGLIVMDEEHETSYQSEMPPKYHAREVAVHRASMVGASVILGSATPSLESYYRAQKGRYTLFTLTKRAGGASLPKVWVTDLREELERKNRSIFGGKLMEFMQDRLAKKEQIILFLNRRGYAGSVSCRKCGEVIKCPHCSVSMTAHMRYGRLEHLVCHYCGYQAPMPALCPKCQSRYIGTFGIGTQKVEQLVRERFPQARVLRMDADTTTGKEGHEKILQDFAAGSADILIGTQMIVKGHDFPNVTLVGILAADLSLNVGDFRAAERTYQLLAQAAGRAGRGEKPGDVVLQTYQPEHYSIVSAAKQDYLGFYEQELIQRQILHYPPVSNILGVLVLSEQRGHAQEFADMLAEQMRQYEQVVILGPAPASLAKAKDVYRYVIYAKCADYRILRQIKNGLEQYMKAQETYRDCRLQFDFNL